MYYDCIGNNGSIMDFFSPPFVNESRPLTVLARDPVGTSDMTPNSTAILLLIKSNGSPSFMGRLTLYISDEHSGSVFTVCCRVSTAEGNSNTDSTTFFMLGKVRSRC